MPIKFLSYRILALMITGFFMSGKIFADERVNYSVVNFSSNSILCVEILKKDIDDLSLDALKNDIEKKINSSKKIKGVEFFRAFQLGDYTNIDVVYDADSREIQWREDYFIENGSPKKLQDAKFHQFYELTYLKLKENKYSKCELPVSDKNIHIINWVDPVGSEVAQSQMKNNSNILWRLSFKKLNVLMEKKESVWYLVGGKSAFAQSFLEQILSGGGRNKNINLKKPVYFNAVLESSGKHKRTQLQSEERMRDYISRWVFVRIVGQVNGDNSNYIYIAAKDGVESQESFHVFQYDLKSEGYIFYLGVEASYESAIFSNTAILDSLVKKQ